jgi:long-chain acyl-CoA synthetase
VEKGKGLEDKYSGEISKRLEAVQPDDVYTIIYTSGTTGLPKGVQGTHRNEVHQMRTIPPHVGIRFGKDSFLSILPVWHIFERMAEYVAIAAGATLIYTSIRDLKVDMREQKPTYMASAPRLWEQVYLGIYNNVQAGSAVKKALFKAAYALSHFKGKAVRFLQGNELKLTPPNPFVSFFRGLYYVLLLPISYPFFKLLDTIVLSKIRAATGGQLRGSISGGGALPRHVDEFFNNIGVNVYEGYGMTESAPVIAARTPQKLVIGSVGPLLPEVEVEIRDFDNNPLPRGQKGVIWTKGPHVMKGYYKMPEQTAKTVVDGWLNTGDMGIISFNDTLSIVGRAKETIVLLGGENVEPVPIENKLLQSEYIGQVMVVGQDKKSLGALIYPDMEKLAQYMGVDDPNTLKVENLEKDETVQDLFINEIKGLVSADTGFKAFEKVTNFRFLPKAMEVDDELTNLGKMKRHVISDKYKDLIESMYQ